MPRSASIIASLALLIVSVIRRLRGPGLCSGFFGHVLGSVGPANLDSVFARPFDPVGAIQFLGMWRANGSVPAREVMRRTESIAAPADSFGVLWMQREASHGRRRSTNVAMVVAPFDVVARLHALLPRWGNPYNASDSSRTSRR